MIKSVGENTSGSLQRERKMQKSELLLRKTDMLLAALLIAAGVIFALLPSGNEAGSGQLVVRVNGQVTGVYPLSEDRVLTAGEGNRFEIREGKVRMTHADCPDGTCLKSGAVGRPGETIVCLPNRLSLTIENTEKMPDADTIAH